jgi:hypothetical protein
MSAPPGGSGSFDWLVAILEIKPDACFECKILTDFYYWGERSYLERSYLECAALFRLA